MGYGFLTVNFDSKIKDCGKYAEWLPRFNSTKDTLKYVATGSEGGGTGFFSKTLRNAGLNASHEHLFFLRHPSNPPYYGACSWFLAPFFPTLFLSRLREYIYLGIQSTLFRHNY